MNVTDKKQHFDTVVIGGGQAGLAAGYYLAQQKRDFVILDAQNRVGTSWRRRWDSLKLFTPASISSLPGRTVSAPDDVFLSKNEVADYLEGYAARFHLPIELNTPVEKLTRQGNQYLLTIGNQQIEAEHVVVATGSYQKPRIPTFASGLHPAILHMHSDAYRNPAQLQDGPVLLVGAGNSGAEIALELAATRHVWLAGRDLSHRPKNIPPLFKHLYWWLMHQAINTDNKIGRRVKEQSEHEGTPLIGIPKDAFKHAGVERVPRMTGVQNGKPQLQDGQVLPATNVIWCTGFTPDYSWIDVPVFGSDGYPVHNRGVVESEQGLYFLGLPFQYTLSSSFIGGVGRDAKYIVEQIGMRPTQAKYTQSVAASSI